MIHRAIALGGLVVALLVIVSQTAPRGATPVVTELQRLQVETLTQKIELAQLRAQAAQRDFDDARLKLTALLKTLEVEGYDLDVATLTYRPKPKGTP